MAFPRITNVRTVLMTGPASADPTKTIDDWRRSVTLIEISTESGITGIGETYAGYFCPDQIPAIVEFFKPILVGQTVENVEELWNRMYHCANFWCRVGLGLAVLNGIEAALWDLKGKLLEKPVWALLGGLKHESILAYASGGASNYPLDALGAKIDLYVSRGFRAIKLGAGSWEPGSVTHISADPGAAADFEVAKLEFASARAGDGVKWMLDGHMSNSPVTWGFETARAVLNAVERFNLEFFEEPLHYTNLRGYTELCQAVKTPVAGGECLTGTFEWAVFIEHNAFDIGQPDASFTGGLLECVKISQMLHERGRSLATHSWGAGPSLLQNIHVAFACANTILIEMDPIFGPLHTEMMGDSFQIRNGRVLPPETPGLGITFSRELEEKYPFVPNSGEFNSVPGKVWGQAGK